MSDEEHYEDDYEDDFEADDGETPPPTPLSINASVANAPPPATDIGSPQRPEYSRSPSQAFPWTLVTLDDLDVREKLAAGAMGAVHGGFFRGRPVAIKTLHDTSQQQLAAVEAELLVHASLNHPRIVELMGANLMPPGCCIVMERCECSLFERLHRRPDELGRRLSMGIALAVAEGMKYLHARRPPIVHRDLKSHNVLIDGNGEAKLCDFGLVNTREATAGTPNYMAPELFNSKPFSPSVDVFAFGVLLNEIWAREVPWDGYLPLDIKAKVVAGERPPTPRTMPTSLESLLRKLWHATAALRPTFAQAIPSLQSVMETLPGLGNSLRFGDRMPMDSLDSLSTLSLKPQRSSASAPRGRA